MKAKIAKPLFANALSTMARVAKSGTRTLPVIECVRLELLEGQGVELSATDLSVGVKIFIADDGVIESGVAVINAKRLSDWVNAVAADEIKISVIPNSSRIKFQIGKSTSTYPTIPAEEYPPINIAGEDTLLETSKTLFTTGLQQVIYAALDEVARPALNSVLINVQAGNVVYLVAADGAKMACKKLESANLHTFGERKILIPRENIIEIERALSAQAQMGDAVKVMVSDNNKRISFVAGDLMITTLVTEAIYPDYNQLFDMFKAEQTALVPIAPLRGALKAASIFLEKDYPVVSIKINGDTMNLGTTDSAYSGEAGSASTEFEAEGEAQIEQWVNRKHLEDTVLAANSPERVLFTYGKMSTNGSLVLLLTGENDDSFRALLIGYTVPEQGE